MRDPALDMIIKAKTGLPRLVHPRPMLAGGRYVHDECEEERTAEELQSMPYEFGLLMNE